LIIKNRIIPLLYLNRAEKKGPEKSRPPESQLILFLEKTADFTCIYINIDPSESRVGACSGHQAYGSGTWAQELGA
jgi:hypothetical protein